MALTALKRPFAARALPGLLLAWIPILEFFSMGYKMACARTAMSGNYELPMWRNWKQLFIFGAVARTIQAIWLAPALITFLWLYLRVQAIAAAATPSLQMLLSLKNLLITLFVLLIFAAVFMHASVSNYVAEARFKSAFSISMLKRFFSKAYLVGWLKSSIYVVAITALFVGLVLLIISYTVAQPFVMGIMILPIELIFLWLPGITYWTLVGEAWGKSMAREFSQLQ